MADSWSDSTKNAFLNLFGLNNNQPNQTPWSPTQQNRQFWGNPWGIDFNSAQGQELLDKFNSMAESQGWSPIQFNTNGTIASYGDFGKFMSMQNGSNSPTFLGGLNVALQGLGQLGNLYGGMQQLKLARQQLQDNRDAFEFNKNAAITNQHNAVNAQRAAYDAQSRARYSQEGLSGSALDNAITERAKNLNLNYL